MKNVISKFIVLFLLLFSNVFAMQAPPTIRDLPSYFEQFEKKLKSNPQAEEDCPHVFAAYKIYQAKPKIIDFLCNGYYVRDTTSEDDKIMCYKTIPNTPITSRIMNVDGKPTGRNKTSLILTYTLDEVRALFNLFSLTDTKIIVFCNPAIGLVFQFLMPKSSYERFEYIMLKKKYQEI